MFKLDYLQLSLKHKYHVFRVGRKMGLGIWQLLIHDLSKFTPAEYPHYQRWFFENKDDPDGFAQAWLHHQNHNPHHWDYWIPRTSHRIGVQGGYDPQPMPMPEKYVREMVADWIAAGITYAGDPDPQPWLNKSYHKMRLHADTVELLSRILEEQGFYWPPTRIVATIDGPVLAGRRSVGC